MATIKDIAQKAHVSAATVSRILNQDESLSVTDQTRNRVLKIAEELNYIKKKPVKNKFTIGIFQWYSLFQELEDPYYQSIRIGIEHYCTKKQIEVIRAFRSDSNYAEKLKKVDGLICIGKFNDAEIALFSRSDCELSVNKEEKRKKCSLLFPIGRKARGERKNFLKKG